MATRYVARHDECGFVGKPTSQGRAARALREHRCDKRRPLSTDPGAADVPAGAVCGMSIDLPPDVDAPGEGDWIVTRAGSRYLITHSRAVRPRAPRPLVRYQMRCLRLTKHCPVPADVRAIGLRWYRR